MKKFRCNRILAALLAFVMLVSMLPVARAEGQTYVLDVSKDTPKSSFNVSIRPVCISIYAS